MAAIFEDDNGTKKRTMNELGDIMQNFNKEITDELDALVEKAAQIARDFCPKDTGALASSISTTGGAISSGSDFYEASIYAGSEDIVNPRSQIPTSQYADFVESGHTLRDGSFYEGVPFLEMGIEAIEAELAQIVDRALSELGANSNN